MLDKIVKTKLRTNMKISNTKVGMQDLFYCDQTIPRRNGLAWIVNDNQKLAVGNALSATQPPPLKDRLESDLAVSKHALWKDFAGFLEHVIKRSEAFQLFHYGLPSKYRHRKDGKRSKNNK